jgi:hypothetical protein
MADVLVTAKAGSTEPIDLVVEQRDPQTGEKTAVDLTNFTAGQWKMWDPETDTLIIDPEGNGASSDGPGYTERDASAGKVSLDPDGAKTDGGDAFDTASTYHAILILKASDGDDDRWPSDGYLVINLQDPGPSS